MIWENPRRGDREIFVFPLIPTGGDEALPASPKPTGTAPIRPTRLTRDSRGKDRHGKKKMVPRSCKGLFNLSFGCACGVRCSRQIQLIGFTLGALLCKPPTSFLPSKGILLVLAPPPSQCPVEYSQRSPPNKGTLCKRSID